LTKPTTGTFASLKAASSLRVVSRRAGTSPETNVMALEGLGPGAYDLRVVVQDRKAGAMTFRKVPFTID